ncbi:hypothetical protein LEP1GSC008_1685 [Leptospira kirschneri serovar Bulgarica str. Nikolaevo]|uniref:Uncharacterized protein n=1 Tax=Leptospira kirschneri serovar Bulgarica str. Nikolaevo TaxID=1240687 RepID=M6EYY2_9LEPT|nr:hypothetical protein LEP1GSC008_1685 [Leptospira kirschneri serovar Bulgarica str. Nikolaevo]
MASRIRPGFPMSNSRYLCLRIGLVNSESRIFWFPFSSKA